MINSPIKEGLMRSPLRGSSGIKRTNRVQRKTIVASLLLTSLVDIMSILVIYLIFNSSADPELLMKAGISLPEATNLNRIKLATVVEVFEDQYFIDNQLIQVEDLAKVFTEIKQKSVEENLNLVDETPTEIIVKADGGIEFEKLNPILIAGAEVGIEKIKFAALQGKKR